MRLSIIVVVVVFASVAARAGSPFSPDAVVDAVRGTVAAVQKTGLSFDGDSARAAVIDALAKSADPGARLLDEGEVAELDDRQSGYAYAIGLDLSMTNKAALIVGVRKGSAAEAAGLSVGESITEIDGGSIAAMDESGLAFLLQGGKSEVARLKVVDAEGNSREVSVARDRVSRKAIELAEELSASLAYLKINGLYAESGREIVTTLRGWAESDRYGLVIDLRGAGGNDVASVVDVASLFARTGGMLFAFRDGQDQDIEVFKAIPGSPLRTPAMVLVDGNTSGAAELLAAVLQGSGRGAMIVGSTTSGDPLVRDVVAIDGLRLYMATKRLVLANGAVHDGREGLTPDLLVTISAAEQPAYEMETAMQSHRQEAEEAKEHRLLRERVRGDAALSRAVDVLLGLKALNIRAHGDIDDSGC